MKYCKILEIFFSFAANLAVCGDDYFERRKRKLLVLLRTLVSGYLKTVGDAVSMADAV